MDTRRQSLPQSFSHPFIYLSPTSLFGENFQLESIELFGAFEISSAIIKSTSIPGGVYSFEGELNIIFDFVVIYSTSIFYSTSVLLKKESFFLRLLIFKNHEDLIYKKSKNTRVFFVLK